MRYALLVDVLAEEAVRTMMRQIVRLSRKEIFEEMAEASDRHASWVCGWSRFDLAFHDRDEASDDRRVRVW